MALLAWIIAFCLVGGSLTVLMASALFLVPDSVRLRLEPHLVSFATGVLLGAAFLGLLPHALEAPGASGVHGVLAVVLVGVLVFFLLEKLLLWRHCHADHCEIHDADHLKPPAAPAGLLILVGDGVHSFVDGILIGAAFLSDVHLGIITALAIASHEVPQQVSNIVVLLQSGYTRVQAVAFSVLTSGSTVLGGIVAFISLDASTRFMPYVLAFAAASFIYIAVADLIPGLHKRVQPRAMLDQIVLISAGAMLIYFSHSALH
ncbi:MAG: ZIP family metal transporter [Gammaproteobacteria bacterium]|nr:ZIP family metal transporter [Gammaproteobacteria bacterium]